MSVTTFFWFDSQAEQAADTYVGLIPGSRVIDVTRNPDGSAFIVTLELDGHPVTFMNGGPGHPQTDAASLQIVVDTQEEVDRLWDALTDGGGAGATALRTMTKIDLKTLQDAAAHGNR